MKQHRSAAHTAADYPPPTLIYENYEEYWIHHGIPGKDYPPPREGGQGGARWQQGDRWPVNIGRNGGGEGDRWATGTACGPNRFTEIRDDPNIAPKTAYLP